MKNTINIIILYTCVFLLGSCTISELNTYEGKPQIYFYRQRPEYMGQKDSLSQSFFQVKSTMMYDTVYVQINTMGALSDFDRPLKIIQKNIGASSAAIPGIHYVAFDDPAIQQLMVVPAGQNHVNLPVILKRDASMNLNVFKIIMEVAQNEYFDQGVSDSRIFLVKTTAMAFKPTNWDTIWKRYFGATWSTVKMGFIIDTLGDIEWTTPSDAQYATWMQAQVSAALIEYNNAHPDNPLRDENGILVDFAK